MVEEDLETVWEIVRETRQSFLSEKLESACQEFNLIAEQDIVENNDQIERKLQLQVNYTLYENIPEDILQTGAEMYTYLNYCPSKIMQFYDHLFLEGSIKHIILAVTNIIKTRRNAERETAMDIWNRIEKELTLFYNNIDKVTRGKFNKAVNMECKNESCDEVVKKLGLDVNQLNVILNNFNFRIH